MKITKDDPVLTAYVLGELEDKERCLVEEEIAKNPEIKAEIEKIKAFSELLTQNFKVGNEKLSARNKQEIASVWKKEHSKDKSSNKVYLVGFAGIAAVLLIFFYIPRMEETTLVARIDKRNMENEKTSDALKEILPVEIEEGKEVILENEKGEKIRGGRAYALTDGKEQNALKRLEPLKQLEYKEIKAVDEAVSGSPITTTEFNDVIGERKNNNDSMTTDKTVLNPLAKSGYINEKRKKEAVKFHAPKAADIVGDGKFSSDSRAKPMLDDMRQTQSRIQEYKKLSSTGCYDQTQAMTNMRITRFDADKDIERLGVQTCSPAYTHEEELDTESYEKLEENGFQEVSKKPLSTFSIDVDTASYSNVRRFINQNQLPPVDSVRLEELVNYFSYHYPEPENKEPFSVTAEVASCPWNDKHYLMKVGLKGKSIERENTRSNLVFLIDVSGSMDSPNKLPLLKKAMGLLVENLRKEDSVAIVVYAGSEGLALDATSCNQKHEILRVLDNLKAGGSTNGGAGIGLAYRVAEENFIKGGNNRVILATDGDFNVGITNQNDLTRLIEEKAKKQIFLTVLGFGMGNYKDATLEKLADKGNGNYGYIDSFNEARKMLVENLHGTLFTIAKDVKIQIEFNPSHIHAYRLIGYENRKLAAEDFNNDQKDAGEIGAGHTVTALYELIPVGVKLETSVDPLRYQPIKEDPHKAKETAASFGDELLFVKLRYKKPDEDSSSLLKYILPNKIKSIEYATTDFKFAASVAMFGMVMKKSSFMGNSNLDKAFELARKGLDDDLYGYRSEFLSLIRKAEKLLK